MPYKNKEDFKKYQIKYRKMNEEIIFKNNKEIDNRDFTTFVTYATLLGLTTGISLSIFITPLICLGFTSKIIYTSFLISLPFGILSWYFTIKLMCYLK